MIHYIAPAMLFALYVIVAIDQHRTQRRLKNLRSNCWLTDEKGHRVRYSRASDVVRARAESN